ncbi:MAG TPA: DNA methyltransferase [Chthoniobacterales bacterium]
MAKSPKASALVDTRVIYCGDNLEQLCKLPEACVDLIYIDPPFNSNRNYEVFWGETKEKRSFADRHESTKAYIEYMRPRCVELHRVLKKTGIVGEMDFMDEWYPIQVKQTAKVGRPDIDSFEAVLIREERKLGYFVGFDFTGDALFEIDRFRRKEGREIKPLTVREILDEELASPK